MHQDKKYDFSIYDYLKKYVFIRVFVKTDFQHHTGKTLWM